MKVKKILFNLTSKVEKLIRRTDALALQGLIDGEIKLEERLLGCCEVRDATPQDLLDAIDVNRDYDDDKRVVVMDNADTICYAIFSTEVSNKLFFDYAVNLDRLLTWRMRQELGMSRLFHRDEFKENK